MPVVDLALPFSSKILLLITTVFLLLGISPFTVVYFDVSVIYVAVCTNYRILHMVFYIYR